MSNSNITIYLLLVYYLINSNVYDLLPIFFKKYNPDLIM